jgi:high-affinity iron transporter
MMLQAFIVVLREGFESFLIVAIILAYLRKMNYRNLMPAVYAGVVASVLASGGMGYLLYQGTANQPMLEGITGIIAAVSVAWLVIHMWQTASHMKKDMEARLNQATASKAHPAAFAGVFLFTALMISREGMETALLLIQIHESASLVGGIALGILAAAALAMIWVKVGHLINLKLFFQVTAIFLLLFVVQILIYSFHEFTEAGLLPNSEALHKATEPFSPDGLYGKWFSLGMVFISAVWMAWAWLRDRLFSSSAKQAA